MHASFCHLGYSSEAGADTRLSPALKEHTMPSNYVRRTVPLFALSVGGETYVMGWSPDWPPAGADLLMTIPF